LLNRGRYIVVGSVPPEESMPKSTKNKHHEPKHHVEPHEDADGNAKYRRQASQGVALVKALFDHDGLETDPARVAEVMVSVPPTRTRSSTTSRTTSATTT
jgi:hypothetical protein